jgi:hypothetical protein
MSLPVFFVRNKALMYLLIVLAILVFIYYVIDTKIQPSQAAAAKKSAE